MTDILHAAQDFFFKLFVPPNWLTLVEHVLDVERKTRTRLSDGIRILFVLKVVFFSTPQGDN